MPPEGRRSPTPGNRDQPAELWHSAHGGGDAGVDQTRIALLGNIPPRDVLADGTPADVARAVREMLQPLEDRSRLIVSCGGGMPPGVPTENIQALIAAVQEETR